MQNKIQKSLPFPKPINEDLKWIFDLIDKYENK
jgi:hypothetical protein